MVAMKKIAALFALVAVGGALAQQQGVMSQAPPSTTTSGSQTGQMATSQQYGQGGSQQGQGGQQYGQQMTQDQQKDQKQSGSGSGIIPQTIRDARNNAAQLLQSLRQNGIARLDTSNPAQLQNSQFQGSLPVLYFGGRKINGDNGVVDSFKQRTGFDASLWVWNSGDFVSVSTTLVGSSNQRTVGETLREQPVIDALKIGNSICREGVQLPTGRFDGCWRPLMESDRVIGAAFVGRKAAQ